MKKIILFALIINTINVFAYDFKIINNLNSKINVVVRYGTGFCGDDSKDVGTGSNNKETIYTKLCCPSKIIVTVLEGKAAGKSKEMNTSLCRHILTVYNDSSGNIVLTRTRSKI